jgi:hypothetical protein
MHAEPSKEQQQQQQQHKTAIQSAAGVNQHAA